MTPDCSRLYRNIFLICLLVLNIVLLAWNLASTAMKWEPKFPQATLRLPDNSRAAPAFPRTNLTVLNGQATSIACSCNASRVDTNHPSGRVPPQAEPNFLEKQQASLQEALRELSFIGVRDSTKVPNGAAASRLHFILPLAAPGVLPASPAGSPRSLCTFRHLQDHPSIALGSSPAAAALRVHFAVRLWQRAFPALAARMHSASACVRMPTRAWQDGALPHPHASQRVCFRNQTAHASVEENSRPGEPAGMGSNQTVVCDVDENFAAYSWNSVLSDLSASVPTVRITAPVLVSSVFDHRHGQVRAIAARTGGGALAPAWKAFTGATNRITGVTAPSDSLDAWDFMLNSVSEVYARARHIHVAFPHVNLPVVDIQRSANAHTQPTGAIAQLQQWLSKHAALNGSPAQQHGSTGGGVSAFSAAQANNYTRFRVVRHLLEQHALYRGLSPAFLPPSFLTGGALSDCHQRAAREVGLPNSHADWPTLTQMTDILNPNTTEAVSMCLKPPLWQGQGGVFPAAGVTHAPTASEQAAAEHRALHDAAGAFSCRWMQCVTWRLAQEYSLQAMQQQVRSLGPQTACWRFQEGENTIPPLLVSAVDWVDTVLSLQEDAFALDDQNAFGAFRGALRSKAGGGDLQAAAEAAHAANSAGSPAALAAMQRICRSVLPSGRKAALQADQPMGGGGPGVLRTKEGAPILLEGLEGVDRSALARNVLQAAGVVAVPVRGRPPPLRMPLPAMPHEGGAGIPSRKVMLDLQKMCKAAERPLCLRSYVMHASLD